MKELTAMQMLIEAMQKDYDSINGSESYIANVQKSEIGLRITQAKSFLKREREQIEKAFDDGLDEALEIERGDGAFYENKHDYYSSKYGGE